MLKTSHSSLSICGQLKNNFSVSKIEDIIFSSFENAYANGYKITGVDSSNFEYDSYASITVK